MLNVALLGGGLFACSAHIPALNHLASQNRVCVKAIYSKTEKSSVAAKSLLTGSDKVKAYWGDELDLIINDPTIQALVVCLPIDVQPSVISKGLKAGKHIFSEKPVAPNTKSGEALIEEYTPSSSPIWGIAENFYYEPYFLEAKKYIQAGNIGAVRMVTVQSIGLFNADSPYFNTEWRKKPNYLGGVLLDGGVHVIAGLRLLVGDIECLSGFAKSTKEDLPLADTLVTSFKTKAGALGTLALSFGCTNLTPLEYTVVGDKGVIYASLDKVQIVFEEGGKTQNLKPEIARDKLSAVFKEFETFVDAVQTKSDALLYTPQQALKDVSFIETMFK